GIASGQEKEIEIATPGKNFAYFPLVDPGTERLDHALIAQLDERFVAALHQRLDMGIALLNRAVIENIDIVDEENFNGIETKPLKRILKRAHYPVIGVVVDLLARWDIEELALAKTLLGRTGAEEPPNFRRNDVFVPRLTTKKMIDPGLGEAGAVK